MGLFDDLPDAGTAPASAGGLFDDLPDAVGTTDYLAEIGKGTARGLVKTLATIPQGVAVAQSADQAEVARIEDGLARLETMPYDEANAFVQSIKYVDQSNVKVPSHWSEAFCSREMPYPTSLTSLAFATDETAGVLESITRTSAPASTSACAA